MGLYRGSIGDMGKVPIWSLPGSGGHFHPKFCFILDYSKNINVLNFRTEKTCPLLPKPIVFYFETLNHLTLKKSNTLHKIRFWETLKTNILDITRGHVHDPQNQLFLDVSNYVPNTRTYKINLQAYYFGKFQNLKKTKMLEKTFAGKSLRLVL